MTVAPAARAISAVLSEQLSATTRTRVAGRTCCRSRLHGAADEQLLVVRRHDHGKIEFRHRSRPRRKRPQAAEHFE
jgi:hypothetical protein